ncbi:MAG TPA: hypothetical protein VI979_03400 [archaeon]|nr:hypothetical protein [archaeon]
MKKPYVFLFVALVASFMLSFSGDVQEYAVGNVQALQLRDEQYGNPTAGNAIAVFLTKNGMMLEKGSVVNSGNESMAINSLTIKNVTANVSMALAPWEFAQYATVGGFIIIPEGPSVINERETSYFPSSQKLSVRIYSGNPSGIAVIVPKGMVPLVIRSSSDIRWEFSRATGKISISGISGRGVGNNTEIYFGNTAQNPIFIEDRENAETLEYRNAKAFELLKKSNATLSEALSKNALIEKSIAEMNASATEAVKEVAAMQSEIANASLKLSEAKLKILSERELGPEIIAFMSLAVAAAIYIVFIRKGGKNEI